MKNFEQFRGQNELAFQQAFSTAEKCYAYLAHYKWKDGFKCPSCGCTEEYHSHKAYHKRCKQCFHLESVTANTLFHKVKFGIQKAFYIVFKMSATTKSISAEQLAKNLGINRKTALLFQHKVRLAMKSSERYPLQGEVEVDEAFIGGQEDAEHKGRGAESKSQIAIAVEKSGAYGIKRVYALKIKDASSSELKKLFSVHIGKQAKVKTDKWSGYLPLKQDFSIEQEKSQPKENFQVVHRCIQQLKSWLRGIHHHVDPQYLQNYLNEFCYRINRSVSKETIVDNLLQRMCFGQKCERKLLINRLCY
jgi:hypothetical protein